MRDNSDPATDSDTPDNTGSTLLERLPQVLRIAAFVMVPLGFLGFLTTETPAFATDSVFTLVFGLGIVCAISSIYLGILLHDPTQEG
ncbi:hypothetical protein OB919_19705 [Halobacteria archaeon AArc-curdl1]|uniref:Uncharacterized protein n=1 Tax=Natronosalvus hydrolyticus TaxID=2979988 RepID=A0AAP2ZC22_9EURY|nr:hypothetical protein [Halobacteria archaeon AArc-curdl1]